LSLANKNWLTSGTTTYYNAGNVGIGTNTPLSSGFTSPIGLDIWGSTAFDGSVILRLYNNASNYGRTQLHLIGRYEGGNDAWTLSGGRNNLIFK
jgi:hypothetical protein